jgi:tetratricopeptide (TPR) repeat protein
VHRGNLLLQEGNYEAAAAAYTEAISYRADLAGAFCNPSGAFLEQDDYDRAFDDSNRAIQLKPDLVYASRIAAA